MSEDESRSLKKDHLLLNFSIRGFSFQIRDILCRFVNMFTINHDLPSGKIEGV